MKLIGKYNRLVFFAMSIMLIGCTSCSKPEEQGKTSAPSSVITNKQRYPVVESTYMPQKQAAGDIIPDFSRVGYRWGDKMIPEARLVKTLSAPANKQDATQMIQDAIDQTTSGAIRLRAGEYYIYGQIKINKSNIVLRGEGEGQTKLIAAGTTPRNELIVVGGSSARTINHSSGSSVKDSYVPCGQFWLRVDNAQSFKVSDNVVIHRPSTQKWISDLKMNQIPARPDGGSVTQWQAGKYDLYCERVVTLIKGDTLHFENPIVMSLDDSYGRGTVYKYSYSDRIEECGVEDMSFQAEYSSADESYVRSAITITKAQHCWVRNITSRYFGMGLVTMAGYSKNITVEDCECYEPKSEVKGGNRYSFYIEDGSLCLVQRCTSDMARHDFATGSLSTGPNVFTDCRATNTLADIGPHHRWNVGTLYDNIVSDGQINVQDRSWQGTGQGWAGANNVVWNCQASSFAIQNPWVSAYNYSIGNVGTQSSGSFDGRNQGVWQSKGTHVEPRKLYHEQLKLRKSKANGGIMDIK